MRSLFVFLLALLPSSLFAGIVVESQPISVDDLRAVGVEVRLVRNVGTIPSKTVSFRVTESDEMRNYQFADFVVWRDEVSSGMLPDVDGKPYDEATRRQRVKEREASFVVYGTESRKAYLAFEVIGPSKNQMSTYRRYLIPVSGIEEE